MKKCKICNRNFIPNINQKYCSDLCKTQAKRKYQKQYRKLHRRKIIKMQKEYYYSNRKKLLKKKKIYRQTHIKQILITNEKYRLDKSKTDINFKLKRYLRARIWFALKGIAKSAKTMKLISCSIEFLKKHLEKQFKKGMNWKNYGKWHIDHIKPCCQFDLSKLNEQKKCFNYKNLQPLWAIDNLEKNKYA
jgi:hypothetical protein